MTFKQRLQTRLLIIRSFLADTCGELDEKALLITLFVLIAMVGLTALGTAFPNHCDNGSV